MQQDFRRIMAMVLKDWGHDVLLQRKLRNSDNPRSVFSTSIPSPGTHNGYSDKLERFTVRHIYPRKGSLEHVVDWYPEGIVRTVDLLYFFPFNASPNDGDRLYDRDDRYAQAVGKQGFETFLVDWALPMRGKGGTVSYWVAGVTREVPH